MKKLILAILLLFPVLAYPQDELIDWLESERITFLGFTTTQRNSLTAAAGDLIYNTTLNEFQRYNGTAWASFGSELTHNASATVAPDNDNDDTEGYSFRSLWYDSTGGDLWMCADAGTASAIWFNISSGGGSGAPTTATYLTNTANGTLSAEVVVSSLAANLTFAGNDAAGRTLTFGQQVTNADSIAFDVPGANVTIDSNRILTVADEGTGNGLDADTLDGIEGAALAAVAGDVFTGIHDFGGATTMEIPNSAAPTLNADGQLAIDSTITDHKGIPTYRIGSANYYLPGFPVADLPTTDNHVLVYDAAGDKFTFEAQSGGGGGGAPTDATYLVNSANGTLSAEVVVSALTGALTFKGDDAAGRTITFGQQVTNADSVAFDVPLANFTIDGVVPATVSDAQTLTNKTLTSPVLNSPTLTLTQSTNPTPTAEGVIEWDTDNNRLRVGDGSSTVTFYGNWSSLVDDATPELGGTLDTLGNEFEIGFGLTMRGDNSNPVTTFGADSNGVNYLNFQNKNAGGAPFMQALGSDTNIGVEVKTKGSGLFSINGDTLDISAGNVTISTAGAALIDDADAAAQRTTLGLAIGSDVQAFDNDLSDLAALTPTKGNILVGNGTDWIAVGVGSNDQVLTADSTEASGVKWAASGGGGSADVAHDSTESASTSASLEFTGLAAVPVHTFYFVDLELVTDGEDLEMQVSNDNGATWETDASAYSYAAERRSDGVGVVSNDSAHDAIVVANAVGTAAGEDGLSGTVQVFGAGTAKKTKVTFEMVYQDSSGRTTTFQGVGIYETAEAINAVRFLSSSGNLADGEVYHYTNSAP